MSPLFTSLPGFEVPVGGIAKSFAQFWDQSVTGGGPAPDEMKATQLNLVLHFGFATTPDDALAQFATAKAFSVRYPARVVLLCPQPADSAGTELAAKIYGECFLGKHKGDTRCVEFVALSYPVAARRFLESQVSVCLSTDLPLYYWAHRFSASAKLGDYQYLLQRSKRFIFDTATAPADAIDYAWPKPEAVRDLAHARLLHVRQSLGQFFAGYAPAELGEDLHRISIAHTAACAAEAGALARWLATRLGACGWQGTAADIELPPLALGGGRSSGSLDLRLTYDDGRHFRWHADFMQGRAHFEADLGHGRVNMGTAVDLLAPEAALSEAMFF